jgi:ComF family protein
MTHRLSISKLLDPLFNLLLPRSCLLCAAPAEAALCPACSADLPRLPAPACPVCAAPLGTPAPACGACFRLPPAYDATHAALCYTFPVDQLVLHLKFGHRALGRRLASADFFASCLLERNRSSGAHLKDTVIVPVPLSRQRLRERGFNQALEIARPLTRALHLPLDTSGLVRVRETLPQSLLPWRARKNNVRHAFECRRDFSGRTVIVVDDVMTTGATLDTVARTLKDHGAVRVINWVAARAVRRIT